MLALRHPLGATIRIPLKVYLSADHISPATSVTVAVVISKNGGAFGNPNAGATNATEIALGWYYVDLDATDTGTLGPVVVRGTSATADPAETAVIVVAATNGGFTALPAVAAEGAGGLYTRGTGAGQINQPSNGTIDAGDNMADGVETGLTKRNAFRLMAAAAAGKLSGAAGPTVVIRNAVADSKDRVTATVDASGNRTAITVDLT
jgi:hypothetical protein